MQIPHESLSPTILAISAKTSAAWTEALININHVKASSIKPEHIQKKNTDKLYLDDDLKRTFPKSSMFIQSLYWCKKKFDWALHATQKNPKLLLRQRFLQFLCVSDIGKGFAWDAKDLKNGPPRLKAENYTCRSPVMMAYMNMGITLDRTACG